jgi:hypothetical protein
MEVGVNVKLKWYEKKYFFGWTNIKWLIKELIAMASNKPSYFSKKRVNEGVAFWTLIGGAIQFFHSHVSTIEDFAIWSGILTPFIIYNVYKIQKEKDGPVPVKKEEEVAG